MEGAAADSVPWVVTVCS